MAKNATLPNGDDGSLMGPFRGSYRVLLDEVSDMVTVSDRAGRIVYANPATEKVTGWTPEEFAATHPFETIHPEDRPRCEEAFERLASEPGLSLEIEHRFRHKDGSWRWAEGTFRNLFGDPEVGGLVATLRDLRRRKRAETALRDSEERQAFLLKLSDTLRLLADAAEIQGEAARVLGEHLMVPRVAYGLIEGDDIVVRRDYARGVPSITGRYPMTSFGRQVVETYGRSGVTVLRDAFSDPDLSEAEKAQYRATHTAAYIVSILHKEGKLAVALGAQSDVPRDWTDQEIALVKETAERTWAAVERARVEEALRVSEERYRTLVENVGAHAVFLLDEEGIVTEWTESARRVKGYEADEIVGRHVSVLYTPEEVEAGDPDRELEEAAREGRAEREGWRVRKDGTKIWVDEIASALRDAGGELVGFAKISRDLTERRELESARERARDRELTLLAEAAERERISRELHDRVAHHMGVAHQSLELFSVLREADPGRAAERLDLARETTRAALDQTRNLAAELKRLQDEELEGGMGAALRALGETMPGGVTVEVSVRGEDAGVPKPVATQAYLAMREAVSNAIRHSGCSHIEVSLDVTDGVLCGVVEDDGGGFDPEVVGRATPSWGVGLRSMHERAEMLGGNARVESAPGSGTRVEVRVPLNGRP